MNPPPLPPHERSWRHPSEMGPTVADVADPGPGRTSLIFGTATVLAVAVGVLVLTLAPRQNSMGTRAAATTVVILADDPSIMPRLTIATIAPAAVTGAAVASFNGIPNGVSSAAVGASRDPATALPQPGDVIIVLTDEMTYRLTWATLEYLDPPDGAIVLDADGHLLGHVDGDALVAAGPHLVADD